MITDPWIAYAQEHQWKERIDRLEMRLQFSLAAACVDHALAVVPLAGQALLETARQALWKPDPAREPWVSRLQAYAERIAETPEPQDPPDRAVDALLYTFAVLDDPNALEYVQEALFTAFWALADAVCSDGGWVAELLGRPGLMAELEAQIGTCRPAYRELSYQETVLKQLERHLEPLTKSEAADLADQIVPEETAHTAFARQLYRRALESLSGAPGAQQSYVRALLDFAVFEQDHGRNEWAAELYNRALAELEALDKPEGVDAVRTRLEQLGRV